nr:uncharacterized mitochondrial protein AtMg00810-like [Tanacetum cinerariifolium]
MGELTLFLGLQVKQKKNGIFISQDKYVAEILRKVRLTEGKSASTPIHTEKPLLKDPGGEDVDVHNYRSMIGSLMYLTSSTPDIMFTVCAFFDDTFGGVRDEEVIVGEGVVVTSSSLEMLTNSCLGGIMVSLIFLEGLEEETLVEFMVELLEEGDKKNKKYGLFN